jgi:hypothetical protein
MTNVLTVAIAALAIGIGSAGVLMYLQDAPETATQSWPQQTLPVEHRVEPAPAHATEVLDDAPTVIIPAETKSIWRAVTTSREHERSVSAAMTNPIGAGAITNDRLARASGTDSVVKPQTADLQSDPLSSGHLATGHHQSAGQRDSLPKPMGIGGPGLSDGDDANRAASPSGVSTAQAAPDRKAGKNERVKQMIHSLFQDPSRN